MKIVNWIKENYLFVATLFLIAFIPLWPKIPVVGVAHTWVYIRWEDLFVATISFVWIVLLLLRKVTLKTPLTVPILIFWIIGGIATLHGVMILFPTLANVFSNVALLSYIRRIEYVFLFFVAFSSIKDKKQIYVIITVLVIVLLGVVVYGAGQKYAGLPAYSTMNEEFAKGIPLQLSALARVSSTFAGHYDLAAYLVLMLPIFASLFFGFKQWWIKGILVVCVLSGFWLLFMTVSRVSFVMLLLAFVLVLILQRKKIIILLLGIVTLAFLVLFPSLLQRFNSTVTPVQVLVDVKTGQAIGNGQEVEQSFFDGKTVFIHSVSKDEDKASSSALLKQQYLPTHPILVVAPNESTGENLPQGTGYVNLPMSPDIMRVPAYFVPKSNKPEDKDIYVITYGDYVIKKALAYDLSSTTRLQGEWPKTLLAFERNIFIGSGYGAVTLAVDNDFLRILGETGLFGFLSFAAIFIVAGIYLWKIYPSIDSKVERSFIIGFVAGTFGLLLNAFFIDVFEASKIAFTYWLLMGVLVGTVQLYKTSEIDLLQEFKQAITSTPAVIIGLFVGTFAVYSSLSSAYFVGDDYTWLHWAADCGNGIMGIGQKCIPTFSTLASYFTEANGFFYRPGTKIFFSIMYNLFWLDPTVYHVASIVLHFFSAVLIYLIAKRIFKDHLLSSATAFIFLILSGYSEAVFWIASIGHLFTAVFILLSLYFFILWKETGRVILFVSSIITIILGLLFHEYGIVAPCIIIAYDFMFFRKITFTSTKVSFVAKLSRIGKKLATVEYAYLFLPLIPYFALRYVAESHWLSGDYNYSLFHLPFNVVGNAAGYVALALLGSPILSLSEKVRTIAKEHVPVTAIVIVIIIILAIFAYRYVQKKISTDDKRIVLFGFLFFIIALLPFLGLGTITSRYGYLSSVGVVIILLITIKNLYHYLLFNGKMVAISLITIFFLIFSSLHLFALQQIQRDWFEAGTISQNFLVSLNQLYSSSETNQPQKFYFVNVPTRHASAWVFPVGLEDALWFSFQDKHVAVFKVASVQEAVSARGNDLNGRIFAFDDSGAVHEVHLNQNPSLENK